MDGHTTNIRDFRELRVYRGAFEAAMRIYEMSRSFPAEERYSMTDQMRRSSRSVCANIAEAWRRRRYPSHFASKLTDAESEAEETRVWLEFAHRCGCLEADTAKELDEAYDVVIAQLVTMASEADKWAIRPHTR